MNWGPYKTICFLEFCRSNAASTNITEYQSYVIFDNNKYPYFKICLPKISIYESKNLNFHEIRILNMRIGLGLRL